ncbi:MAG: hypothetical protein MZV63_53520 [Marinilabiliales bacterium]|nr:hypothetical protein [Marinilabiliales bacterium]
MPFVAITFLSFFFLKDEGLFKETVMVMVPDQYEERIRSVLHSIKQLLIRYFIGIIIQSTIVLINITIGMTIVRISVPAGPGDGTAGGYLQRDTLSRSVARRFGGRPDGRGDTQ